MPGYLVTLVGGSAVDWGLAGLGLSAASRVRARLVSSNENPLCETMGYLLNNITRGIVGIGCPKALLELPRTPVAKGHKVAKHHFFDRTSRSDDCISAKLARPSASQPLCDTLASCGKRLI